jgi:hypothetical protein
LTRRLKAQDFLAEKDYLNKAIYIAFANRKVEAVRFALRYMKIQNTDSVEGSRDLYLAKKILQIFPEDAEDKLLDQYNNGNAITKKNVIYAVGEMAGGDTIRPLLIDALDDDTFCEQDLPELVGEPLRICDLAYNQLVLRYGIKNVLRTIGTVHRIEVRDYHIDRLKDLL